MTINRNTDTEDVNSIRGLKIILKTETRQTMKISIELTTRELQELLQLIKLDTVAEENPNTESEEQEEQEDMEDHEDQEDHEEQEDDVAPKPKKRGGATQKTPVDILIDGEWKRFDTISVAAAYLGCSAAFLGQCLKKNKPCQKRQVRYSDDELDAILAEIKESNRKPYEPSKPIR